MEPNTRRIVSIAKDIEECERRLAKLKNELRREIGQNVENEEPVSDRRSAKDRVLEVLTCCYPAPVHRPWLDMRIRDIKKTTIVQTIGALVRTGKAEHVGSASYRARIVEVES